MNNKNVYRSKWVRLLKVNCEFYFRVKMRVFVKILKTLFCFFFEVFFYKNSNKNLVFDQLYDVTIFLNKQMFVYLFCLFNLNLNTDYKQGHPWRNVYITAGDNYINLIQYIYSEATRRASICFNYFG